ncbi:MAG: hypothetical protein R2827_02840 [Bdellovibrionales bacterium]
MMNIKFVVRALTGPIIKSISTGVVLLAINTIAAPVTSSSLLLSDAASSSKRNLDLKYQHDKDPTVTPLAMSDQFLEQRYQGNTENTSPLNSWQKSKANSTGVWPRRIVICRY